MTFEEKRHGVKGGAPAFDESIIPYLEIDGIEAAALVSTDGLLVTWAGDRRIDPEVISANAASVLSSLKAVADELDTRLPRIVNLGLSRRDLILAPLTRDLALVLVGRADAIRTLARAGSF